MEKKEKNLHIGQVAYIEPALKTYKELWMQNIKRQLINKGVIITEEIQQKLEETFIEIEKQKEKAIKEEKQREENFKKMLQELSSNIISYEDLIKTEKRNIVDTKFHYFDFNKNNCREKKIQKTHTYNSKHNKYYKRKTF